MEMDIVDRLIITQFDFEVLGDIYFPTIDIKKFKVKQKTTKEAEIKIDNTSFVQEVEFIEYTRLKQN